MSWGWGLRSRTAKISHMRGFFLSTGPPSPWPNPRGEGPRVGPLPRFRAEFAHAMCEATLLPALVALLGVLVELLPVGLPRPQHVSSTSTGQVSRVRRGRPP